MTMKILWVFDNKLPSCGNSIISRWDYNVDILFESDEVSCV